MSRHGSPGTLEDAKTRVAETVDRLADELEQISHQIHANPELCFQEHKASAWLADFLAKQGATVERGVGGLPTAFRATIGGQGPGPTVATWPSTTRCRTSATPAATT
jgi:metal-dependent amidase/aminoacylase/carboxypeptidase family protein